MVNVECTRCGQPLAQFDPSMLAPGMLALVRRYFAVVRVQHLSGECGK